jgi:transposase
MPLQEPPPVTLTVRQRRVVEGILRRETSTQQQVRRARVVLAAAGGANNEQVARTVGVTDDTARTWRGRWRAAQEALLAAEAEGGAGDEPRPGAPATFTPEQLCQLMAVACEPPGDSGRPISHWTPRELADEVSKRGIVKRISVRTVGRFLVSGRSRTAAASQPVLAHTA